MTGFALTGSRALVTGGTRGIGLASARALAEGGLDVVLVGRDADELARSAESLASTGRQVAVEMFDLSRVDEIRDWFIVATDRHGPVDVLVNAAGVNRRGPATELTLADWNAVVSLNATAVWELSRCFAEALISRRQPGRIVNIASLMTAAARPGTSPYTASKGAIGQLTKVLAVEWASEDILVNAVAPGYIATDLNRELIADPKFDAWVKGRCPLGRWGRPEEIAGPVAFLTSKAANFMTGQTIYVDGGWLSTF